MTKHKLTPWFSGDVKPVRRGFYERNYGMVALKDFFDGENWRYKHNSNSCFRQDREWRGIQK